MAEPLVSEAGPGRLKLPLALTSAMLLASSTATGWLVQSYIHGTSVWWTLLLSLGLLFLFSALTLGSCGVAWGRLEMPSHIIGPAFVSGALPVVAISLADVFSVRSPAISACLVLFELTWVFTMRAPSNVLLGIFLGYRSSGCLGQCDVLVPAPLRFASGYLAITFLITFFMPYQRDARLTILLGHLVHAGIVSGSTNGKEEKAFAAMFCIVGVYLVSVVERRRRVLPVALRYCRYVRLGYLRQMLASGVRVARCQELPSEAFGDVAKAERLIITSHRWLDPYSCDICNPEFPMGVRLETMMQRLGLSYPESLSQAAARGWYNFPLALMNSFRLGGSDVLIFFDFMCLPQIGRNNDGGLIDRTAEELEHFMEALPAMGALYTTYQVIVLPEVTAGVHPYFASGWCFSELCSAMLTKKLDEYSPETVSDYMKHLEDSHKSHEMSECIHDVLHRDLSLGVLVMFEHMFSAELAQKKFFSEGDRQTVSGIIEGFVLKRLLMDSVAKQDLSELQRLLSRLKDVGLTATIDHALDESLDTLVHIACRLPSAEIVDSLIENGADPSVRNLRGDLPTQFFMFPRFAAGARACRAKQSAPGYVTIT